MKRKNPEIGKNLQKGYHCFFNPVDRDRPWHEFCQKGHWAWASTQHAKRDTKLKTHFRFNRENSGSKIWIFVKGVFKRWKRCKNIWSSEKLEEGKRGLKGELWSLRDSIGLLNKLTAISARVMLRCSYRRGREASKTIGLLHHNKLACPSDHQPEQVLKLQGPFMLIGSKNI